MKLTNPHLAAAQADFDRIDDESMKTPEQRAILAIAAAIEEKPVSTEAKKPARRAK